MKPCRATAALLAAAMLAAACVPSVMARWDRRIEKLEDHAEYEREVEIEREHVISLLQNITVRLIQTCRGVCVGGCCSGHGCCVAAELAPGRCNPCS